MTRANRNRRAGDFLQALRERAQEVGAGEIVPIGRRPQRDPLRLAGRHKDTSLLAEHVRCR
jgi:hypothetical protein